MNDLPVSYVIATDRFETVREVVRAVSAQTVASSIELVLVCPDAAELERDLEPELVAGLGELLVLEEPALVPLSVPRAAGVRAAQAPLVFIGETHSFPEPDCVEQLLAAHATGEYAVVMPTLVNGNPRRATSWANLMVTYREWLAPATRGEVLTVSTYNGCFRRDLLLGFGERLPVLFEFGSGLDAELRALGYRLLLEPAAQLRHLNVASLAASVLDRFLAARIWGAGRARRWSRARRLAYGLAAPVIPAVVVTRVLRSPQWAQHRASMPAGTLAWLLVGATVIALGEAAGYLAGAGSAPGRVAKYELHRARYL